MKKITLSILFSAATLAACNKPTVSNVKRVEDGGNGSAMTMEEAFEKFPAFKARVENSELARADVNAQQTIIIGAGYNSPDSVNSTSGSAGNQWAARVIQCKKDVTASCAFFDSGNASGSLGVDAPRSVNVGNQMAIAYEVIGNVIGATAMTSYRQSSYTHDYSITQLDQINTALGNDRSTFNNVLKISSTHKSKTSNFMTSLVFYVRGDNGKLIAFQNRDTDLNGNFSQGLTTGAAEAVFSDNRPAGSEMHYANDSVGSSFGSPTTAGGEYSDEGY